MNLLKVFIGILFGFLMIFNNGFAAGLNGKITYADDGMIKIENLRNSIAFEIGEQIEVSYMAGILEMPIGKYEVLFPGTDMVIGKELSLAVPPEKGMIVLVSRLSGKGVPANKDLTSKKIQIDEPDPGAMLPPSEDPRFFPENSGGSRTVQIPRYNANLVEGEVIEVMGKDVRIKLTSSGNVYVGDLVDLNFQTSSGAEVPVGLWSVTRIDDKEVFATALDKTTEPGVGMKAKIIPSGKGKIDESKIVAEPLKEASKEKIPISNSDWNKSALEKSARQGDPTAQNRLGMNYQKGIGVKQDYQKAIYWYRKAAEQDYLDGQNNMGWMYQNGLGVEKDIPQAAYWYKKAAEQGYASAQNNLGGIYHREFGGKEDLTQAFYWYQKAAEQGNARAQNNLGTMYIRGEAIPLDREKAILWFKKAAVKGNQTAKNNLKKLGEN